MKRIYLYLVVLLGIFVVNATPVLAQQVYLQGTVVDQRGNPVNNASVRADNLDKNVITDKQGNYKILVPKGTNLIVTHIGFNDAVTTGGTVILTVKNTDIKTIDVLSKNKKKRDVRKVKIIDPKAAVTAVDSLLNKNARNLWAADTLAPIHKFIKDNVYERFKKDPETMLGIAKAYYNYKGEKGKLRNKDGTVIEDTVIYTFYCEDSINAYKYIDYAISADSKFLPAYVFAGDIQLTFNNQKEAIKWYNKAIDINPQSPLGYISYAKLFIKQDTVLALKKLRELAKHVPTYHVDLEIARLFYDIDDLSSSYIYFDKTFYKDSLNRDKFSEDDFVHFAASCMAVSDYRELSDVLEAIEDKNDSRSDSIKNTVKKFFQNSYDAVVYGLNRYPSNIGLIRSAFYFSEDLGNLDSAVEYGKMIFGNNEISPNTKDYLTFAKVYAAKNEVEKANRLFDDAYLSCTNEIEKILADSLKEMTASQINKQNSKLKELRNNERKIVDNQVKLFEGDYDKMAEVCYKYIDAKKKSQKSYYRELVTLIDIYQKQSESVDSNRIVGVLQKLDSTYENLAIVSPDLRFRTAWYRLNNAGKIDKLNNNGLLEGETRTYFGTDLAKQYYNELIDKLDRDELQDQLVQQCCSYLMYSCYEQWNSVKRDKRSPYRKLLNDYANNYILLVPGDHNASLFIKWTK